MAENEWVTEEERDAPVERCKAVVIWSEEGHYRQCSRKATRGGWCSRHYPGATTPYIPKMARLLPEVATLMDALRAIADGHYSRENNRVVHGNWRCAYCWAGALDLSDIEHDETCPTRIAQDALKTWERENG